MLIYQLIFFHTGDFGVTETVAYSGTVLDEATEWIRFPINYLFHMFEGSCVMKSFSTVIRELTGNERPES